MYEVKVPASMRQRARAAAKKMGTLKGSILKGEGNLRGEVGERVVAKFLGGRKVGHEKFTHDIELDGIKIEVKTNRTERTPSASTWCWVFKDPAKIAAKADVIFFAKVNGSADKVWLCGWLPTAEFVEKAVYCEPGSNGPDGKPIRNHEWGIPLVNLRDVAQFSTADL